eukprot:TRINITY_DN17642_c1_g3_i2.p1 TRINITY_DN17642_c1_g3~~TRINITY_DN17642_c1_g3_i2.p1  ORF type:complete len:412 (+),score=75.64 TRINITY_DN17642_c1_g3_i2:75-1238(+)
MAALKTTATAAARTPAEASPIAELGAKFPAESPRLLGRECESRRFLADADAKAVPSTSPSSVSRGQGGVFHVDSVSLDQLLVPGDVLVLLGSGQLSRIGTVHGLLGHALLVTGVPRIAARHPALRRRCRDAAVVAEEAEDDWEAELFAEIWPESRDSEPPTHTLWRVPTLECTRAEKGLYEAEVLVYVNHKRGNRLTIVGEITSKADEEVALCQQQELYLWQSPPELRETLREDVLREVLAEMRRPSKQGEGATSLNWSRRTALRALLRSARLPRAGVAKRSQQSAQGETKVSSFSVGGPDDKVLRSIEEAWRRPPICTSVVIIFWQRYISRLAADGVISDASSAILRWMPLLADRALPGDLARAMEAAGWARVTSVPALTRAAVSS